jgi:phage portal protein BeeE
MSAIDKVLSFIAPNTAKRLEGRSRIEPVSQLDLAHYLGGGVSWTNIDIDRLTVMGLPVVWACMKVLSETLASFPLVLYEGSAEGQTRRRAEDHPMYDLLRDSPNPQQDMFCFKEQMMGHLCIYGNCYANIVRDGSGYVRELWPLNPERIFAFRLNGELLYRYRASPYFQTQDLFFRSMDEKRKNDWQTMGDPASAPYFLGGGYKSYPDQIEAILKAEDVFHIHAFGFDGIRGYSPLELQRETMGLAIAAKHYAADFFANNGTPDIAFSHSQHLTDQATRRLQDSWRQNHAKHGRKHTPIILEEGMTVQNLNVSPDKAQLIEVQKFLVAEIARIYRIPPHLIQDLERATFSNIEHQAIEFVQHTMRPWAIRWESAISRQLLSEKDRKQFYPEFYMDSILRGDVKTRAEVYLSQIGSGMLSPNEARQREQMNDREGGDTYYVPLNWVDANMPNPKLEAMASQSDKPNDNPAENSLKIAETRSVRSAKSRRAIANSFGILLKDAAARIVRKECHDLKKAIGEQLKLRDANSFTQWLEKYYRELPDYIKKQITPVYQAFSNAIRAEIANELGTDESVKPEDEHFVRSFADVFVKRYIGASKGQMEAILRDTAAQDMETILDERLSEWEDTRADKVAMNEKTQASNAFAKNIYRLAGIASLVWMAMGSKPCDYCLQMDGMQTDISDDFAYNGEEIPDDRSLSIGKNIGHPPLHRGCECQIMAGGPGRALTPTEIRRELDSDVKFDLGPIEAQIKALSERQDKAFEIMAHPQPQEPANVTVHSAPVQVTIESGGKVKKTISVERDENGDIKSLEQIEEKIVDGE